jgi:hypothetical protein
MKAIFAFAVALSTRIMGAAAQGTAVVSPENEASWWEYIPEQRREDLSGLFEPEWFGSLTEAQQISYSYVAQSLYDFLATGIDSHPHDSYTGFGPLLLRASFHAAGSFHAPSGTGGTNGGTIFVEGELNDPGNSCIDIATQELDKLFRGSPTVSLADAMVIAGSVALDDMHFPRMDLLKITGGRCDLDHMAHRDRLPSADDNPINLFTESYNLTHSELTALIGGAHNFGSAHGVCTGYVGQWTSGKHRSSSGSRSTNRLSFSYHACLPFHSTDPLSWISSSTGRPEFFVDLMKTDWRWYEVCTYTNGTSVFESIPSPFVNGVIEDEAEHDEDHLDVCAMEHNDVTFICEQQAMRGCDFEDGVYGPIDFPCDINLLQFRLRSDFFLKVDRILRPFSAMFAEDDDLLAQEFGVAYHKLTHAGLTRCGLSGTGCGEMGSCTEIMDPVTGRYLTAECIFDPALFTEDDAAADLLEDEQDDDDEWHLGKEGSIASLVAIGLLSLSTTILTVKHLTANKKKA